MDLNFVNLLRCPASQQRLREASHAELEQINTRCALSNLQENVLEGALIREDQKIAYPIRNGIPVLLVEEGFSLV
ncbi:MAG TPA: Trm112 family protein [Chthoniobacterales bacterium]|nr:Trm112 family protein [Chthoniobacterales bacterium]